MSKKKGFITEFKEFASRGNVVDMAVGVIIGAAFKAIVDSLVNDVVMPFVGIFLNTESLAEVTFTVGSATIKIGSFLAAIVNFLLIAFIIFCMVKFINSFREKLEAKKKAEEKAEEEKKEEEPKAPTTEELLAEILKELKEKK